jgi:membrane protein YqaA with SNARE-associated domain
MFLVQESNRLSGRCLDGIGDRDQTGGSAIDRDEHDRLALSPEAVRYTEERRDVRRFGRPALLLSWVPLIGDVLVALAGAANVSFGWFSLWVILGKSARYAAVAWLTMSW